MPPEWAEGDWGPTSGQRGGRGGQGRYSAGRGRGCMPGG